MRIRWWAAPGAAAAVAFLAACGSSGTSTGAAGSASSSAPAPAASTSPAGTSAGAPKTSAAGITTARTSKGTVLTTAAGDTIYWFAIDTPTASKCTGSCATFWPPVTGKPAAASGSGLTGKFGTITRPGGTLQATYDGHPLYLFAGDTKAGQVNGNDINTSGGLWWATTPTGAKLTAAAAPSAAASKSGSGGSGY